MKKTFKLWSNIFASPSKGFVDLTPGTPILLPLLVLIILLLIGFSTLIPILSNDAYSDALMRVQINTMRDQGTEMSSEQIDMMMMQLQSSQMRTITILSSTLGGVIMYLIIMLVTTLILLVLARIFKEKTAFKHLFKILIFIAVIGAVQTIVKNSITLLSNYERILSRVQYTADLQWAITSPVSLAALVTASKMNPTLYSLIDVVTDIFNWIYYIYLFFGLKFSAGIEHKKALAITIISAALVIAISLITTLFI